MLKQKWLATIPCMLLMGLPGCGRRSEGPVDAMVDVGTHRLHIQCWGAGRPTIVVDTGAKETYESWLPLIESLAKDTRVCAYDRAAHGKSDPGPMPRDAQREMDELHTLLGKAGERDPFLLLGHSLGAVNLQVYAAAYPKEVAGLVLLDPPPLDWMVGDNYPEYRSLFIEGAKSNRALAAAALSSAQLQERAKADSLLAVASEMDELFGKSAAQVAAIHTFGNVPLVVIGATAPNPGPTGESFRQFWNSESQELAGMSARGQFIAAEGSSHSIYLDAPDLVHRVIRQMLSEIRG